MSIDPLAEKYPGVSPYVYTFNNPLNYVDPTGMEGEDPPLTKNVMVLIGDVGRKTGSVEDNENWKVIKANNFKDAHSKIQEYTQGEFELDNLVIREHGSEGKIVTDNFNTYISSGDVKAVNDFGTEAIENPPPLGLLNSLKENDYNAIMDLQNLVGNVNEGGNVILSSCTACAGESGKELGKQLVKLFSGRVDVYLNQDVSFLKNTTINGNKNTLINGPMSTPQQGWVQFPRDGSGPIPLSGQGYQGGIHINTSGPKPFTKY